MLLCLSVKAATNTVYVYTGYPLLAGQHAFNTTSNANITAFTNSYGYIFNTNDTTYTAWQFPAQIITGTNLIVSLYQIVTNTNSFNYIVNVSWFKHNGETNGLIYSTNTTISSIVDALAVTNFSTYTFTNRVPTNYLSLNTNTAYGIIRIQHTATNITDGGNVWLQGGRITFRN